MNQLDDNLIGRRVRNIGTNTVTLSVDINYSNHLRKHNKPVLGTRHLKPGEEFFAPHMYVIITTSDGRPAILDQKF